MSSPKLKKETLDLLTCAGVSWLKGDGTVWIGGVCYSDAQVEIHVTALMAVPKEDLPRLLTQNPSLESDRDYWGLREPIYRWRLQNE